MSRRERRKLRWLRANVGAELPNIYRVPGFRPDGCTCSPDSWWGLGSFAAACDYHDWLYHVGGAEADRQHADDELGRLMRARALDVRWPWALKRWPWLFRLAMRLTRRRMRRLSRLYREAVRCFGEPHFHYRPAGNDPLGADWRLSRNTP